MAQLTLVYNDLNKPIPDQLGAINLALQGINSWAQVTKSTLILDYIDPSVLDKTIDNTAYQKIGYEFSVTPQTSLNSISGSILLNTTAESTVGIFVDGQVIQEYIINITPRNTWFFSLMTVISAGAVHSISLRLKGKATVGFLGQNKVQILSISA